MEAITYSEEETAQAAADFAVDLKEKSVLLLHGNLGAGKTVFARGLIRALTGNPNLEVPSPTFTLAQTYETNNLQIWHFDLYRLKDPEEIYELGWEDALAEGIVLVEWPERLGSLKPARYLDIAITTGENDDQQRNIEIVRV